mgnify:FL=1
MGFLVEFYSSKESDYPGVGYPSCSRVLARAARNTNDPNGYYEELGLYPWATDDEIRTALRTMFKRYHPDGTSPDEGKFMRFKEIGEVLLNPVNKKRYEATKSGELFIDSEIRQVIALEGISLDEVATPFDDEEEDREIFFDYFAADHMPWDMLQAQHWYEYLVAVAPMVGYTKTIRVMLHDGKPDWLDRAGILMIPRGWKPNSANAFGLLSVLVPK